MRRALLLGTVFVSPTGVAAACAWPSPDGNWSEPPGGPPAQELPDAGPQEEAPTCPPVGGIAYERAKPNVMFLVDRSGSMAEPGDCGDSTCPSKWQQLLALGSYLGDVKGYARLGMAVFPSAYGDGCSAESGVVVPLSDAPDVDERILQAVMTLGPGGRTPIAAALDDLIGRGELDDPLRDNVIVLLTDGQPNCACEGIAGCDEEQAVLDAVARLRALDVPIRLNVVGFGSSATEAGNTLTAMAEAAGTARPGTPAYWQANTVEELVTNLYAIAASLASCRFNLDATAEPDHLIVHVDDAQIAPCFDEPCTSGYSYDAPNGIVELHGQSCQALRDGACHNVWFEDTAAP